MERRAPDEARLAAADWASKGVPSSIMMSKPFAPAQLLTAVSHVLHTDAPTTNELMETTMTDAAFDAQGPGTADRNPRINAEEGATWRMTVRIVARPAEPGQKTPREHGSSLGVRNGGALASINSRVTGKGDDSFNLIWS